MALPRHPSLQRLVSLWQVEVDGADRASLGRLSARDLQYFYQVFKDSFVARGPATGPFRLSFIGTDIESHIGRRVTNAEIGDCFNAEQASQIRQGLVTAIGRRQPLLVSLWLHGLQAQERLSAEILCLPFHEPELENQDPQAYTTTIFGMLAINGLPVLPPASPHRELLIERLSFLSPD